MRAFFSNEDMANLIQDIYKDNTISVTLIDEDTREETESDMVSYLNVKFYTWWEHLQTAAEDLIDAGSNVRESWKESMKNKLGSSYALIEQMDEATISSQDIIGATISGRITFMIDANKVKNLEYYLRYLKSKFTGNPITRACFDGSQVVGYLTLGILLYDQQPEVTPVGESIVATLNWKFNYMALAATYNDITFEISLDNGLNYKQMPIIKYSWQNIFVKESVPTAARVDLAGFLVKAISHSVTISFYDFDKELTQAINSIFWRLNAVKINDTAQTVQVVNIPIYLRVTVGTDKYTYKCVLTDMQKVFSNNEFTISSITLNGWGKVGA